MKGDMTDDDARQHAHRRALATLFAFSAAQNELARIFARSRGMHATDAAAIVQIIEAEDRGEPLTPARLAERIALTSGATSILLNRLEAAEHIHRAREHADRRVVTLHSTPAIQQSADAFYDPLAHQLSAVLAECPSSAIDIVDDVVGRLNSTIDAYLRTVKSTENPAEEG
jgi:MarR family transcriptional regulator, organic hydroperoxide resistance regulator